MTNHRITVDLSSEGCAALQELMRSGLYTSEGDAIEASLIEEIIETRENTSPDAASPWTDAEVQAAIDEDDAHPEEALTLEQFREHFGIRRRTLVEAA